MPTQLLRGLLAAICAVGLLLGPAAADDVTGSESETQMLDCIPEGEPVPGNQEAPEYGAGECVDDPATSADESRPPAQYEGTVWTNEVTCDSDNQGDAGVLTADGEQNGTGGEVGLCSNGALPIHGRLVLGGSMESGGMYTYVDGDNTNGDNPAAGWARVDGSTGGPAVSCGDEAGRRDASEPTAEDTQDDCG